MGLDDALIFTRVVECHSFTQAALGLGMQKSTVSRRIALLEERLGVRLLNRTTRKLRLTEVGQAYYERCRQIMLDFAEAEQAVMQLQLQPSGLLRISIPTTYAHHRLLPLLPRFRALYPQVTVDIHISNRNIDFVGEGYDLAIRVRAQPDSTMVARLVEDAKLVVVASPDYLKKAGTPQTLEDLVAGRDSVLAAALRA